MESPTISVQYLHYLWKSERRSEQICEELGCTINALYALVRKHKLGRRPPRLGSTRPTASPDPTEEEIAERAAAIRATWTPEERRARMVGGRLGPYTIPHYYFDRQDYSFSS